MSSQNVYVQFANTDDINLGDTLYVLINNVVKPALLVKNKSSISCVGAPFPDVILSVSNEIFAFTKPESKPIEVIAQQSREAISVNDQAIDEAKKIKHHTSIADFDGRLSLSSYLNNTSDTTINSIFRLNLALNARQIANSKFSTEIFMTITNKNLYRHRIETYIDTADVNSPDFRGDTKVTRNVSQSENDVRVYNLVLSYDFDSTACLSLGRKINSNLANIGAVDGLQFEKIGRKFSWGAVIGTRPDTYTYTLNTNLLQYGAFMAHAFKNEKLNFRTSVAIFNQMNNLVTDRRFAYIQHSNSLMKNMDFFGSMEVDLFGEVNNKLTTKLDFTSSYLSIRYRPWKKLSVALTYDARKNIHYYETYKNYADSILDKETRQGFRFQTNFRPFNKFIWGTTAGYRLPTNTTTASINGNTYFTYTRLPFIDASITIDATLLKTNYVDGMLYGASLSRDFLDGKLFADLSYRFVDYKFNTGSVLKQNIAEISISWRIAKKLMLSANFEGTSDTNNNLNGRVFVNISQRF
ncbi:MAG: hypothetical protein Q7U47_03055 [Paludibacter sp.]|nr:hypothetical protein [Paludibacter sp.]